MQYFNFVTFFPIYFASVLIAVLNHKNTDIPVILPILNDLGLTIFDPCVYL